MDRDRDDFLYEGPDEVLREVLAHSIHAEPVDTIEGLLWTYRVDELRELARGFGVPRVYKLNKGKLVDVVLGYMSESREQLVQIIECAGADYVNGLHALMEVGGLVEIPMFQLSSFDQVVFPHPPCTMLFDWRDSLYCVVPKEVREELYDIDWDRLAYNASAIDGAVDFLDLAVDLRGIVRLDEAFDEYRARVSGAMDLDIVERAIQNGASGVKTRFSPMELLGERCLVHGALLEGTVENGHGSSLMVKTYVGHGDLPPRPVSDELMEAGGVAERVLMDGHADGLAQCLARLLPDDVNPQAYLPSVLVEVVETLRGSHDFYQLVAILQNAGLCCTDAEADELARQYATLLAHVPRWDRNGWSWSEEMQDKPFGRDDAQVLQFVPRAGGASNAPAGTSDGEVVSFFTPKH